MDYLVENSDGGATQEITSFENQHNETNVERKEQDYSKNGKKSTFVLTAYCHCEKCCGKTDKITASGEKAVEGVTVAADTNILPFGTQILIENNVYTVQDKGGAIKGNRIDVYFDTHEKALEFGGQTKEIIILK